MKMNTAKQWINKNCTYIIAILTFLMVYISKDTLLFGTNESKLAELALYGFMPLTLVCLAVLFLCSDKKLSKYSRNMLFFYGSSIVLTALVNLDFSVKYGWVLILVIIAVLYTNLVDFSTFSDLFIKIMCVLSIGSLIGTAIYFAAYSILQYFPVITNISGLRYAYLYVTTVPEATWGFRNYGIFREPGMFIIFLNIALLFELNKKEKTSFWRTMLLCLTVLSTLSTAGYIVTAFIMCFGSFGSALFTDKKNRIFMICTVAVVVTVALLNFSKIYALVFEKLFTDNHSKSARFGSIWINFLLLLEKPIAVLVGRGFTATENGFITLAAEKAVAPHNTTTVFKLLALFGFPHLIVFLRKLYVCCAKHFHSRYLAVIAAIAIFLLLNNEEMVANVLVYLLSFYACVGAPKSTGQERLA